MMFLKSLKTVFTLQILIPWNFFHLWLNSIKLSRNEKYCEELFIWFLCNMGIFLLQVPQDIQLIWIPS